jgi:repressor LexA
MGLPNQAHADNVPVLGRIAAGMPMLAQENIERYVAVPDYLTGGGGSYFALRVQGDSMIDAGIYEGDLVIVRSTQQAANGDIVVALTGEEATVKRLMLSGDSMYLKPENPAYAPIPLSQAWSIQGKVVALIREQVA